MPADAAKPSCQGVRPVVLASILAGALAVFVTASSLAAELRVYDLAVKAGRFYPEMVEVPAGQKFKLRVKNEGPGVEEFESSDLNREQVVASGATLEIFLGPLEPGRYKFFGDFHRATANGQIIAK